MRAPLERRDWGVPSMLRSGYSPAVQPLLDSSPVFRALLGLRPPYRHVRVNLTRLWEVAGCPPSCPPTSWVTDQTASWEWPLEDRGAAGAWGRYEAACWYSV